MEISVSSEDRSLAATDAGIRERIRDFKIKLIWKLCTDLLVPPLPPIPPLKFPPNSTGSNLMNLSNMKYSIELRVQNLKRMKLDELTNLRVTSGRSFSRNVSPSFWGS